ncbi:MAG: hypothetical protein F4X26_06545 [Chloroflexi bacterium]|nr:hypothetical protein [Chloroflexota bacterium]
MLKHVVAGALLLLASLVAVGGGWPSPVPLPADHDSAPGVALAQGAGDGAVEVRVAARRLADGRTEFAFQQLNDDGSWAARQLPARRFFPADAEVGRWLSSSAVTVEFPRTTGEPSTRIVRVAAQLLVDGRMEFALQERNDDGSWADRRLPTRRFFPADAGVNRWLSSSPLTVELVGVAFSPGGDEVPRLATVTIEFPVTPSSADGAALVSIEPAIEGSFAWSDDRTLLFQPAFPGWQRGQRYVLRVAGAAAGLARDYTHAFTVEGGLEVAYVIPGDRDREVPTEAQVLVQFNRSVAALTVLQEGDAPPVLEFDPPLAGKGEWLNTSLYRFVPSDLRPSTTYRVRIPAGLTSAADGVLGADFTWTFETIQPAVVSFEPADDTKWVEPDGPFVITFNQPMDRASVEAGVRLRLTGGSATPLTFEWSEGDTVATLTPSTPLELGGAYEWVAPGGMAGAAGGVTNTVRITRFTVVGMPERLSSSRYDSSGRLRMSLTYNNPMDPDSFEGRVTVSGVDPDNIGIDWGDYAPERVRLDFPVEPETTYTVRIAPGVRDRGGRAVAEEDTIRFTTEKEWLFPELDIAVPASFVTYAANGEQVLYFAAQKIEDVQFSLYRLSDADAETLLRRGYIDERGRDDFWPDSDPIRTWTVPIEESLQEPLRVYSTALGGGSRLAKGHYFLFVTFDGARDYEQTKLVVSVVDTAIVTKLAHDELIAWALDYETGEPLAGAPLRTAPLKEPAETPYQAGRTDAQGLARFAVDPPEDPSYWEPYDDHVVRMEEGGRFGVASTWWDTGAHPRDLDASSYLPTPVGHLYTDRPIYRPGETVSFKAVLRDDDDATYSVPGPGTKVTISARDPRRSTVYTATVVLGPLGTASADFTLAADALTGRYNLSLVGSNGGRVTASFTVAEFRVPEFEVEVETAGADYVSGDSISTEARAAFYFGGPLPGAHVEWHAQSRPTTIRVDGYEDYSFSDSDYYSRSSWSSNAVSAEGEARTDASGVARFEVPATLEDTEGTHEVTISATVTDASGRAVAGSAEAVVHPATWYAGIKPESYVGRAEEPLTVHLVTVDYERTIAPGRPVTVRVYQREWMRTKEPSPYGGYRYSSEPVDTEIQVREVTTDDSGEGSFSFAPPTSGAYRLVAESTDDAGRVARSARFIWATGRDYVQWPIRWGDIIELIADREEYEVGDVAEVLVPAPFDGSTALVTIERGRVLSTEVRTLESNSEVLRIPIEDKHIPNIYVSVVLYRPPTDDDPYPRYSIGTVELKVSTAPRRLDVRIEPGRDEALPGDTVPYEVTVTDADGLRVAADVSVAIVDQAVLALAADRGRDGMEAFWYERQLGVRTASSLAVLVDRWNESYRETEEGTEGDVWGAASKQAPERGGGVDAFAATADSGGFEVAPPVGVGTDQRVRSDFRHTALWIGQLTTGADGTASFELPLPDNTTTWQARARAVTPAAQAGEGESELLVTQPLLVRPSLPRFLRVGDEAMLRTLVTNRTDRALRVTVDIEADGVTLDDRAAQSRTVAPNDSAIFEWPARAVAEGTATVRFSATATGGYTDAVELSIPVHLDVTPETTATGGVVEDVLAVEAVYLPDYVITGQGSLELSLQGSLVGALDEELAHFEPYKYESAVRIASRVVAAVAVQRASVGGLDAQSAEQLRRDVRNLILRQTNVSGWSWGRGWGWCESCRPDPVTTGWVLLALGEARDAGHDVPDYVIEGATTTIVGYTERETDVERPADPNEHAFLLYALVDASNDGREVSEEARAQAATILAIAQERRAQITNWGRAYVLLGLLGSGHSHHHWAVRAMLNDLTADTIASANGNHWEDERTPGSMHNGSVRITAIVLRALTEVDPQHPLIEETTRWLALGRAADRWKTTVERAQGMASLGAYAQLTGETRGVYDYSVLVNTDEVLAGRFDVPAGEYLDATSVALADLPPGEVSRVQFEREAGRPGRMYYGLNLRYVTPAAGIDALNRGFAVSHRYSLLDDPDTAVTAAAVGDVVRVTVTVIAPADRLFVRVEDFLPAGLEPIDPQLDIVSPWLREQLREDQAEALKASASGYCAPWYGWCYSPWDQADLRDDRLVLQASELPRGVHEYVYYARATVPGDFFVAPVQAEETYLPDVFGRSDSSRFTVLGGE